MKVLKIKVIKNVLYMKTVRFKMSGSRNSGTFTQWNTTQQKERRSSHPSRQHGWN